MEQKEKKDDLTYINDYFLLFHGVISFFNLNLHWKKLLIIYINKTIVLGFLFQKSQIHNEFNLFF